MVKDGLQLFVFSDAGRDGRAFALAESRRIELEAERARAGHRKARFERRRAAELVVRHHADVRAHARERVDHARAGLDLEPRERVRVVAGPNLGSVKQHPGSKRAPPPEHPSSRSSGNASSSRWCISYIAST